MKAFCLILALSAAALSLAEEPYAFRAQLTCVHRTDRRAAETRVAPGEFAFADGCRILAPEFAKKDFEDYLKVSMGVSCGTNAPGVTVEIDTTLQARSYLVDVGASGVSITAADERAAAQALYHLEDLMNLRKGPFLKFGHEYRRSRFSPRMVHSGYDVDVYPDGYLSLLAHYGFDAIVIFMKTPEKSEAATGEVDVNDVIARAKARGIDTYLYTKIRAFVHPSDPAAYGIFRDTYGKLARLHPEAKGIVFVGESCEFPSKDPRTTGCSYRDTKPGDLRPPPGWFPCSDYPQWISAVREAVQCEAPKMEIVFWTYNWGRQDVRLCADMVRKFPKDVVMLNTFYKTASDPKRNGLALPCEDYTISFAGPGSGADAESRAAYETDKRVYSMVNTGGRTWDFGTVPFEPVPYQWKRRWDAIVRFNRQGRLQGLMESHHYGWCPSFVSELCKEAYTDGGIPFDRHLRLIAARDFGEENVAVALAAWEAWSRAIVDYPATDDNEYGPFRLGPAYPFNFGGPTISPVFAKGPVEKNAVAFPQPTNVMHGLTWMCDLNWRGQIEGLPNSRIRRYDRQKEIELLQSVADGFASGAALFAKMKGAEAARAANLGEYFRRAAQTGVNVKKGQLAFQANDREALNRIARDEYENAKAALPLLENDSRLGFEASMGYAGGADVLRWKLRLMEKTYGLGGSAH